MRKNFRGRNEFTPLLTGNFSNILQILIVLEHFLHRDKLININEYCLRLGVVGDVDQALSGRIPQNSKRILSNLSDGLGVVFCRY